MLEEIRARLDRVLPGPVEHCTPVAGGDIGRSFRADTRSGPVFVKAYDGDRAGERVEAEAAGLAWLAQAGAVRVPAVRAVCAGDDPTSALLALEWIEPCAPEPRTDEALGRGLASLHAASPPVFGLASDNFIGPLPQRNAPCASWPDFYRDRRLLPMLEQARARGRLDGDLEALAMHLVERLPERVGPAEPPARLHGDLWGGNWLCGPHGEPFLVDPAVYAGHREVDLAMMLLFGGFSDRVFAAYSEAAADAKALAPDWRERVPLYQLYPLLVHLNLFGASYAAGVERSIRACL